MSIKISDTFRRITPPDFKETDLAAKEMKQLVMWFQKLTDSEASPSSVQFISQYQKALQCYDRWQELMIASSDYSIGCSSGCTACCNHWVEDVGAFEIVQIAQWLRVHYPDDIPRIVQLCREDSDELLRLEQLMREKLEQIEPESTFIESTDTVDLLLSVFYQMRRPCPLLSSAGTCMVYPVRPLTCRMYLSVSDPIRCDPEYINDEVIPTCLLQPCEEADRLFKIMHDRSSSDKDDTGLRSQLNSVLSRNY